MAKQTAKVAEQTLETILTVALRHFGEYGFAATSLEEVVREAGVTRGALYHHFKGKQALFEAVIKRIQQSIATRTALANQNPSDLWQGFIAACHAWLNAASDPQTQKILLIDAPAVLGWEKWLQIDAESGASLLREGLLELQSADLIQTPSIDALFHLLNGAMNQAALWIAQNEQPELALQQAQQSLEALLAGIIPTAYPRLT